MIDTIFCCYYCYSYQYQLDNCVDTDVIYDDAFVDNDIAVVVDFYINVFVFVDCCGHDD